MDAARMSDELSDPDQAARQRQPCHDQYRETDHIKTKAFRHPGRVPVRRGLDFALDHA